MNYSNLRWFLLDRFALDGDLSKLCGDRDDNFLLTSPDASQYVIKVMHTGAQQTEADLQCRMIKHLDACSNLPIPQLVTSKSDQLFESFVDDQEHSRYCWVLKFIPGILACDYHPLTGGALINLGQTLAQVDLALRDFSHCGLDRSFSWRVPNARWCQTNLELISIHGDKTYRWLSDALEQYETTFKKPVQSLPSQAIHGDANDHNILLDPQGQITGIIDFGDCCRAPRVCDLAIACTYFAMNQDNPWLAIQHIIRGYHQIAPLNDVECEVLFPLIQLRLLQSLAHSQINKRQRPQDDYVVVSEQSALRLINQFQQFPRAFTQTWIRHCADKQPLTRKLHILQKALAQTPPAPILPYHLSSAPSIDLSPSSGYPESPFSGDLTMVAELDQNSPVVIGRYGEARLLYQAPEFKSGNHPTADARTIHAGVDLFVSPNTPVSAPLDGKVYALENRTARQDYGPTIVLQHELEGHTFFTLYGHLSSQCLQQLTIGSIISKGQVFCEVGAPPENGDWVPHLHFQWILEDLNQATDIDGVCHAWSWPAYRRLFANPAALLNLDDNHLEYPTASDESLSQRRRQVLARNLAVSYDKPIQVVRGWQQYLFDQHGRCYLDAYNNVPHVGHCHPRVNRMINQQLKLINTNSRYLHQQRLKYAEALTAKFPDPLNICFLLNSASEANEVALRLARNYTQARDLIVIDDAYHGHTTTLIDISPYKADGSGGHGCPEWVHQVPAVDLYRGPYRYGHKRPGLAYAEHVNNTIKQITHAGKSLCGFICESMPSVGGQLVFPDHYLSNVYAHVRAAGGLCIADEVQTGFARTGHFYWGFEQQKVTPDIVVLGKPMGNGFPLGAVITSRAIADAFDNGMEFFSTFGGNTVACAAGSEVLRIIEEEHLQQHMKSTGDHLLHLLRTSIGSHPLVGDIRGLGFFIGIEIVKDRQTQIHAVREASYIKNRLRNHGILIGTDGPKNNVLKIRPPAPFNQQDAEHLVDTLTTILGDSYLMSYV